MEKHQAKIGKNQKTWLKKSILLFVSILFISTAAFSQNEHFNFKYENIKLRELLDKIQSQSSNKFLYKSDVVNSTYVKINVRDASIQEVLKIALDKTSLTYQILEDKLIVISLKEVKSRSDNQPQKISGTVIDPETGESLVGVSVMVKGSSQGTISDINGKFSFNVTKPATLIFSYIGYLAQNVQVTNQNTLTINLLQDAKKLNEVIVVGYGTVKRANVVGSISKINADAIENRPITRVEQALQGQMAGVSVRSTSGAPGSDITVSVRGVASINGVSTPLYVVDGVPIDNLSGINPSDIKSIDVLKDAASAAIYGSRGSNGVVLVTTKKGKTGKPVITLNASTAYSTVERKVDVMNSNEWVAFNEKWLDRQWVNKTGQSASVSQADRITYAQTADGKTYNTRALLGNVRNTYGIYDPYWGTSSLESIDWQDALFRTAPTTDIQLSASGATDKINYSISGGVYQQQGVIYGSSYERYNLRANIEAQMTDKIKVGITVAPSYGIQKGATVDGKDNAVSRALTFPGWVLAGSGRNAGASPYKFYDTWGPGPNNVSPYIQATATDREKPETRINTSLNTTINLMKGLNLAGLVAWNTNSNYERIYTPTWSNGNWDVATHPGEYSSSSLATLSSNSLLYQGVLTYTKEWGIHSIDAMIGASQESYNQLTTTQKETNFSSDQTWVFTKTSGTTVNNNDIAYSNNAIISFFGRVQYSLLDRYLMTASLRRDGSSKFGLENRWGYFPSVSGAWKINEEPILKDLKWIGTAKLRLSWGQAGNDRIGNAQFLSNMSALNYVTGTTQALTSGYVVGNIANPLLGWEITTSTNIGFDFGILKDRIYLSADYYYKKTDNLLLSAPVSLITGFTSMMDNVGSVENRGMEFELNTANIVSKNFSWNSSLNISFNRNKITSLGTSNSDIRSGQGNTIIQRVGSPINSYMLLQVERTLRTADFEADGVTPKAGIAIYAGQKAGDSKWKDINNDNKITSADYAVVGSYQPKFEWGFTNTFRYKNFDASILTQGRVGGKLLSIGSRGWNRATNGPAYNYMNRWLYKSYWSESEPGDGMTPAFYATVTGGQYDTNWLYDASYIRIKNISLGYTLNLRPNKIMNKVHFYASCDNVYMWDHYSAGYSPEAATQDNASSDWGSYPQAKTYSIGVNITF